MIVNIPERTHLTKLMLEEALQTLNGDELKVLVMRNAYGFTIAEVERATGRSYRWIQKRYYDGLFLVQAYFA